MKLIIVLVICFSWTAFSIAASTGARIDNDLTVKGVLYLSDNSPLVSSSGLLSNKGTWGNSTNYSAGDVVQYSGSSYVCNIANINVAPPTNASVWSILAAQGPQGAKGDTGAQGQGGAAGPQGIAGPPGGATISGPGVCGIYPATKTNYVLSGFYPAGSMSGNTPVNATSLAQLLSFYAYPSGNVLGFSGNYAFQFTSNGALVTKFLQFLPSGYTDMNFPSFPVAGSKWKYVTINGSQQAMVLDTSPVRHAFPYDIFFTMNGQYVEGGYVLTGPAAAMTQATPFTSGMVSGKSTTLAMKGGYVTATFNANGSLTGTNPDGSAFPAGMIWSINGNGQLVVAGVYTFTIVGGSSNCWAVTYTDSSSTQPSTVIGPIPITLS